MRVTSISIVCKSLALFALFSASVSCSTIPSTEIKNVQLCGDLMELGAECSYTRSSQRDSLTKAEWDKIRLGRISLTPEGLEHLTSVVERLCYYTKSCTYEQEQEIKAIVNHFRGRLKRIKDRSESVRRSRTKP